MEDSGAILCQISSLKDMVDQVNEDIEVNIQRTREIESEMVKCSEVEKHLLTRESEHIKLIIARELELNDLIQVAAVASTSMELLKKELSSLRSNWEEMQKRMTDRREKFIALCGDFHKGTVKGETDELRALLLEKVVLENEKRSLDMKINALGNSTSAYVEETLEELRNSNSVLQVEVHCRSLENEELLKDIDELKNSLLALE